MKLLINTSNRKKNCYKILNDIKENNDYIFSLSDKEIKPCNGCSDCKKGLVKYCSINDDMQELYKQMTKYDKIVIATPIHMNFFCGQLKIIIDRLRPHSMNPELLKNKKIYLIITWMLSEEENKVAINLITKYFESLTEFMEFNFKFLGYLSSGIIEEIDDIEKNNANYKEIIEGIKNSI